MRDENNLPFKWRAIRPAEMQESEIVHPIGYLAGTTERGMYDTVIKSLRSEFSNDIEISYQTVFQPGVSQKVWNFAQRTAKQQYRNVDSRERKVIKLSMPPSSLIIYTIDTSKVKEIRRQLIKSMET